MLSEALVAFGRTLTRLIFRVDLKAAVQGARTDGEFDAIYRLLDNTWRAIACALAWIFLLVMLLIPWGLTTSFRATNPTLSRAIGDVGSGVVVFVSAGWLFNMARMALAVTLAQRETRRALSRIRAGSGSGAGEPLTPPGGFVRLILVVTRPTDFDFVLQLAVGVLVFIAVVNYAHAQGYPL